MINRLTDFVIEYRRKQVSLSRSEAEKDQVVVPMTIEEYCIKHTNQKAQDNHDFTDFYDDDYGDDYDDDEGDDFEDEDDEEDDDNEEEDAESDKLASGEDESNVDPSSKPSSSQTSDQKKLRRQEVDSGNEES